MSKTTISTLVLKYWDCCRNNASNEHYRVTKAADRQHLLVFVNPAILKTIESLNIYEQSSFTGTKHSFTSFFEKKI